MYKDRQKLLAAHRRYNEKHREERRQLAVEWRKKNKKKKRDYDKNYEKHYSKRDYVQFKNKARKKLREAVSRGEIIRLPCVVCGIIKSEAHHEDYSKPLDVVWLCRKHHFEKHRLVKV